MRRLSRLTIVCIGLGLLVYGSGCGPLSQQSNKRQPSDVQVVDAGEPAHQGHDPAHSKTGDKHEHTEYNCLSEECMSPPASSCLSATKVRVYNPKGSCHAVEDKCIYAFVDKECEGRCHQGQCYQKGDPCTKVTCAQPPAPTCVDDKTLRTYDPAGHCQQSKCLYPHADQPCAYGCADGKCLMPTTDPCANVRCTKPPAAKCTSGSTLRTYYATGRCEAGRCKYSHADQRCPRGCAAGKCKLGEGFSAVNPFRALDTRSRTTPGNESTLCVQVAGRGNVPTAARAVYVNVVAVSPSAPGFLTAYPKGARLPGTSTLNYSTGKTTANGSIIKVGSGGQICTFVKSRTDVIIDVYGYFDADADFFPKGPYRRLDTRDSQRLAAGKSRCYTIAGRDGIPTSARAVFVNLAAVRAAGPGYLTIYPKGAKVPSTSNLNYAQGQTIAGGSIVEIGDSNQVCVYTHAAIDLIIDVYGYFSSSSSFEPLGPKRLLDTRKGAKPAADATRCYRVTGVHGIPGQVKAIAFNIAAVGADRPGFLQVFTSGIGTPSTSTINYHSGSTIANNALVQPGVDGKICVRNSSAIHYILDVVGYWRKSASSNACAGIVCQSPPAPICSGTRSIASYHRNGTCRSGLCYYTLKTTTCSYRCHNAKCIPKPKTPPPPSFQYHPVTSWQSAQRPVRSGSYMDLKALRYITIHYNGGSMDMDGRDNVYQDSDFAQILRNHQLDYTANRGYSLGYNSAVAPDGDEWEIRGLRYRAAANGCGAVNRPSYTIYVPVRTVNAAPTAAQIKGVNAVIARIRAAARAAGNPHHLSINGHRDVRPFCGNGGTACPGPHLYQMIKNGTFK